MPSLYRLSLPLAGCVLLAQLPGALPALADAPVSPSAPATRTVYLDSPAAVEHLKADDPQHYEQVRAILAAADVICAPGPASISQAGKLAGYDAQCEAAFLKTSYPPKRELSFRLGDTHYIALVVLTHDQPALSPATLAPR